MILIPLISILISTVTSLSYSYEHSFRGDLKSTSPKGFELNGHSSTLPGVTDYLRLVPPIPLGFGGIFTSKPMESEEWVVEMAFRVHGRNVIGDEQGHKGGRGLAFWYTKSGNPTPITASSNNKQYLTPTPPIVLDKESESLDSLISLFGNKIKFDGLAIIFDTSPSTPLISRSKQKHSDDTYLGASVVSGIMDDGTGNWLDENKIMKEGEGSNTGEEKVEAGYLSNAIGACEAAFRNTDGVLFARISHINQSIKVELDLTPHTSLAVAGRDYAHTCFKMDGVKLSSGSYFGITGLNSAGSESDSVDIYSMEVFEVIKNGKIEEEKPAPVVHRTKPLDGTSSGHSLGKLTHELFLAQARQVEATDDLARRIDALALKIATPAVAAAPISLDEILTRLTQIELGLHANVAEVAKGTAGNQRTDSDVLAQLLQFQERLMVEIKGLNRKIDGANSATTASLQSISTRHNEHTTLLQEVADISSSTTSIWWYLFGFFLLVGGFIYWKTTSNGGGFGGGKKMI